MGKRQSGKKRPIESYGHEDKRRANNPPVGLVTPATDQDAGKKTYQYDPHLDPQLVWAGKAEHTRFAVPTVSLHVHERIDPRTIIAAVRKNGRGGHGAVGSGQKAMRQLLLFEQPVENPPLREAIEFYKHAHNWTNRMIAGDSLLVMNSLLEKEGMAGKVQMVYIDPPYGIKYGSNFQPFVNKRDVKDGSDDDLNQEPEMIRAFRDTWELGIHSYLTYLRDRLLLARELLHESGSCFVQINDDNLHHVRELMDEVFLPRNLAAILVVRKTAAVSSPMARTNVLPTTCDYIVWYVKEINSARYRQLHVRKEIGQGGAGVYSRVEGAAGDRRRMSADEMQDPSLVPPNCRVFRLDNLTSTGWSEALSLPVVFQGTEYRLAGNLHWKTTPEGLRRLIAARRVVPSGKSLAYVRYSDDFSVSPLTDVWLDTGTGSFTEPKVYAVQTNTKVIQRCMLMTTDPGDLVLDPTCGSGTTAYVAEQWGRRWVTCDTSRVAIALAKQRLMTALYDYYELAHPQEGVGSGFIYKTVPHVTLKSIANNPEIHEGMTKLEIEHAIAKYANQETLYDQPKVDNGKARVTGPFTVEAVPAPAVRSIDELGAYPNRDREGAEGAEGPLPDGRGSEYGRGSAADISVSRSGETLRQDEWRGEMLKCGIRGKGGQRIRFSRIEPLAGTRWLHADAETDDETRQRVVISFGPEHAPLEQRQVEQALEEANTLKPTPKMVAFATFQFDPEAAKDIDETQWPGVTLLKVQMNTDLLTDDLKKKRASNESFWMIGQPDVQVASEEWLVDSCGRTVAPYEFCKVVSGLDRLAEINGLGAADLRFYAAIAGSRAVWADLATAAGGGVDSGQYRRRAGQGDDGGVSAVPWCGEGFTCRIGDAAALVARLGLRDERTCRAFVDRLRGDKQVAERSSEITLHSPLTTRHFFQIEVRGFDYYNPKTGAIESGDTTKIAIWMLDTDYDGRSLYPRQVFFPMAGDKDGWARLARNLKAEIDEERIESYRGTVSLPFEAGEHERVAVKIVDDRGIESLKIVELK